MRIPLLTLCILGIALSTSGATEIEDVKVLETRLWEAWHNHDLATWTELTAPEYVWADGKQLRNYASVRSAFDRGQLEEYKTTEMQAVRISADVVVLSYRASMKGMYNNKPFQAHVAENSIWVKQSGGWRNAMLQEVEVSDGETQVTPPTQP